MKPILRYLFCISAVLVNLGATAQEHYINYYKPIAKFDLAKLWHDTRLPVQEGNVKSIDFPEPLGYIGRNFQRFYIHYISVKKDSANPYLYHVTGKTKVNHNICNFTGTITVIKASFDPKPYYEGCRQGNITCRVSFREDSAQTASGYITGKLSTDWFLDKKGAIHYDTLDSEADSFCNNQCEATWTNYKTHQSRPCNWGDFRIPNSRGLDGGAGEFMVDSEHIPPGWKSFADQFSNDKTIAKRATSEEDRKWWE